MTEGEFVMRSQEAEVGHGHVLRVTSVEQPCGSRVTVIQKIPASQKSSPILAAENDSRVVVDEDELPELVEMLRAVQRGEA